MHDMVFERLRLLKVNGTLLCYARCDADEMDGPPMGGRRDARGLSLHPKAWQLITHERSNPTHRKRDLDISDE